MTTLQDRITRNVQLKRKTRKLLSNGDSVSSILSIEPRLGALTASESRNVRTGAGDRRDYAGQSAANPGSSVEIGGPSDSSRQEDINTATTNSGGSSRPTSVVGEAGELLQVEDYYIYSIDESNISDEGFIQNLNFVETSLSESDRRMMKPDSVYIAADLYLVAAAGGGSVYDYTPVTELNELQVGQLGTNMVRYDPTEKGALEEKAGKDKMSAEQITNFLNMFAFSGPADDSQASHSELMSNIIENKVGIKLSSF